MSQSITPTPKDDLFRFSCVHCGQRVKVSPKRAGAIAKCPKCQKSIQIPSTTAMAEAVRSPHLDHPVFDSSSDTDPSEFEVVYDSTSELDDYSMSEPRRVSVPRSVIFVQGMLLVFVGTAGFFLGTLFGRSLGSPKSTVENSTQIVSVSGRVEFADRKGKYVPDIGSVVLCLPQDRRPDFQAKASFEGLRPGDPLPDDNHPTVRTIRSIGGEFTRVDETGKYSVRVSTGKYYVLILSKNATRLSADPLDRNDLAQIGRYVEMAVDLLGNRKYEWRELQVAKDRTLNASF